MGNKDIISLQIGGFSNFVGAHLWNSLKKSSEKDVGFDHDVMFCSNKSVSTPRLIAVDLNGSLGPCFTEHQTPSVESQLWEGVQEIHETEGIAPKNCNQFEQADCVWTDYLDVTFHPRSINLLPEFQQNNQADPFDIFPLGVSCMREERRDILENCTRLFAEECDYLQGFQILLDASNGFGGLSCQLLQHLNEEYSNKTLLSFPIFHSSENVDRWNKEQLINANLVINSQIEDSSMFCPLSLYPSWTSTKTRHFSHVALKPYLQYHTSSIIATALETVLLPLQKKDHTSLYMRDITDNLAQYGRKAVGMTCAIPLSNMAFSSIKSLELAAADFVSLFPGIEVFKDSWRQNLVWRGVENIEKFQSVIDQSLYSASNSTNTLLRSPCSAVSPYPQFFIDSSANHQHGTEYGMNFSTYGGLHSSPIIGDSFKQLYNQVSKINVKLLHRYLALGVDEDELLENRCRLLEFSDCY